MSAHALNVHRRVIAGYGAMHILHVGYAGDRHPFGPDRKACRSARSRCCCGCGAQSRRLQTWRVGGQLETSRWRTPAFRRHRVFAIDPDTCSVDVRSLEAKMAFGPVAYRVGACCPMSMSRNVEDRSWHTFPCPPFCVRTAPSARAVAARCDDCNDSPRIQPVTHVHSKHRDCRPCAQVHQSRLP